MIGTQRAWQGDAYVMDALKYIKLQKPESGHLLNRQEMDC